MSGTSEPVAEVVRSAARRSLAVSGVRVYRRRARASEDGWTEPWSWEVGVADPACRTARLRHFHSDASPVIKLAEGALRRWPWLVQDHPLREPDPSDGAESIEIGRRHYYGGPRTWIDWGERAADRLTWTLWPLEALLGTAKASAGRETEVRGESCTRYVAEVLPSDAATAEGVVLVDPPRPDDGWRVLHAEISVDGSGLVRRIVWSAAFAKTVKLGLLPRIVMSVGNAPPPTREAENRIWHVTEFWDYGCEAQISAPTELIDPSDTSLRTIVRDLRHRKRDDNKRHGG